MKNAGTRKGNARGALTESRRSDVERYGLLALGAMFLLAAGFLLEEWRLLELRVPEVTVDAADAREVLARTEPGRVTSREVERSTPGGGESASAFEIVDPEPFEKRGAEDRVRPEFDFFEPPVALPGRPAPRVPLPGESFVVVRRGDTLTEIARRELGDPDRWQEILRLNHGLDPNNMQTGTELRIPVALGKPPVLEQAATPAGAILAVHEVRRNDTLSSIAKRYYGREGMELYLKIQEANRDLITDIDRLELGTELRIPALER